VRELIDRKDLERRVLGRDGADLVVAGVWLGALEEDTYLRLLPFEIRAQHRHLLIVAELSAAEPLGALAHSQFTSAGGPQVAHRLGFAAGRDEINGGPRG